MTGTTQSRTRGGRRRRAAYAASAFLAIAGATVISVSATSAFAATGSGDNSGVTATPIQHVVVIFDENISYDHYFGTYPNAVNAPGETPFTAASATPTSNNYVSDPALLTANPNQYQPARLTPAQAVTCDQNHQYGAEQLAMDGGKMDQFVQYTAQGCNPGTTPVYDAPGLVMNYYDGNTVAGLWNYAQNYTMSDNAWESSFGPSTPGALNLIAGQTHGGQAVNSLTGAPTSSAYDIQSPDSSGVGTVINDPDPYYDDCSDNSTAKTTGGNATVQMQGKNIGDLLNAKNVTWGWFQGGFTPSTPATGTTPASCLGDTHANVNGATSIDYSPHHSPFQYYASTSNPHHLAPSSDDMIGKTDQANHQYDLSSFDTALASNNLPAVSFLKAPEYQDGHANYSDPVDEQHFLVKEINAIESSSAWPSTAIVINYDDSDGWYDHASPTILNGSTDTNVYSKGTPPVVYGDQPMCQSAPAAAGGYLDRCGPGPRLPLLVISPWTKQNNIDHSAIEQTSITQFIEQNWSTGSLGDGSFDTRAGSLNPLFDFTNPQQRAVLLNENGTVGSVVPVTVTVPTTPTSTPTATPSSSGSSTPVAAGGSHLASTGLNVAVPIGGAALLVAAGVIVFVVRRRRHVAE
ncbi:phospholipase C [Subtercola lobariae]|uniref:Phospholipase C n=1 Tax=Subtercola lobariae TaxID=1588641 RepID=A0A917F1V5_9MICO|nr:alkaline phosphatase family protein [Subtercola lobariae]GGF36641.1 phospholipase C [Subtercola lobariae]